MAVCLFAVIAPRRSPPPSLRTLRSREIPYVGDRLILQPDIVIPRAAVVRNPDHL